LELNPIGRSFAPLRLFEFRTIGMLPAVYGHIQIMRKRRSAFTLIELLVVIAIIAILAAILFPVFARAKESAKKTACIAQARQLSASVQMYASDYDEFFVWSTNYDVPTSDPSRIWSPLIQPYLKNKEILVAPGSTGKAAENWDTRNQQSIGYSGATAIDTSAAGCDDGVPNQTGCEGFTSAVSFVRIEESTRVGLFAVTPVGPMAQKYRGYVFSPYNGPEHPNDPKLSAPLAADRDLVKELGGPPQNLPPKLLKPIYAMYGRDGKGNGVTPIIFADGHTKAFSANAITGFGSQIIWRFR